MRESQYLVLNRGLGGKDEYREFFVLQPDTLKDRYSVNAGQHNIQNDQVRYHLFPLVNARNPVRCDLDVISLEREVQLQTLCNVLIVFNNQYTFSE